LRVALALAAVAAGVGAITAVGSYLTVSHELRTTADATLSATAADVGGGPDPAGVEDDDDPAEATTTCPPTAVLQPAAAAAAQVVREDGTLSVCLPGGPDLSSVAGSAPGVAEVRLDTTTLDGVRYRVATVPFHEGGWLQLARDLSDTEDLLDSLRARLTLLTVSGVATAALLGWLLAGRIARPVVQLRDATRALRAGADLTAPLPVDGPGEVGDLARSFAGMVDALTTSREQQRRLVADASHELRTPLTSLTTNLELLDQFDRLPPEDRPEVLGAVQADVDDLTHLTTELVDLASDRGTDEPAQAIDLTEVADAVAARARRRTGRAITVESVDDGAVRPPLLGRPQMLERAIANLVDNAVKYGPPGAPVEVVVTATGLEVRDHGPGIPDGDEARVFERFYRSPESGDRPGSGLGLAIVEQVVARHGGRVWARNDPTGGACVGFDLAAGARSDAGHDPGR
jgi:two-component system sensor histidine kinase MprB